MPLIARTLPEFLVPSLFRFAYTVDELLLLLVLATGAGVGTRKGLPLWSYTWIVLALGSMATFFAALLPTLLQDVVDFRAITYGWLVTAIHLFSGLLVLAFAASRATLGLRYTFFVAGIFLAGGATRPHILEAPISITLVQMAANAVSILLAGIMLAAVVAIVMRFLQGDAGTQRRSVYVLIAVALVDPILTTWVLALRGVGTGAFALDMPSILASIFGIYLALYRWAYIGMALLITYALIISFLWLRKVWTSSPAPSGGVNG